MDAVEQQGNKRENRSGYRYTFIVHSLQANSYLSFRETVRRSLYADFGCWLQPSALDQLDLFALVAFAEKDDGVFSYVRWKLVLLIERDDCLSYR